MQDIETIIFSSYSKLSNDTKVSFQMQNYLE